MVKAEQMVLYKGCKGAEFDSLLSESHRKGASCFALVIFVSLV